MSEDILLSIKDFSEATGIKQTTLRYYDELELFSPIERSPSGYRYYSAQQIITVNILRVLGELGYNTKQMSDFGRNRTPETMLNFFMSCEEHLEDELRRLHSMHDVVSTFRRLIHTGISADEETISVQYRDELHIIIGPENSFRGHNGFTEDFVRFCESAGRYKINLSLPVGGMFCSKDKWIASPDEPSNFFSIDPRGTEKREAGNYLIGYTRGYYGNSHDLPGRMVDYAKEHNLELVGPVYNIYILDEISVKDPEQYLLESAVRVMPKNT
jgi:DNA-binding transcriptional MerR regulator